ncbi:MAG: HlyD family efflux transporter periplasmic adaptor subunit [Acidobacteriota bacterium]|jgi:hypothetical protein
MAYHDRDDDIKKVGRAGLVVRILGIVLIVALVVGIVLYRNAIWNGVASVLALSRDEEPIPVLSLEKGPLQIEVQADGEIVGMQTVPVATPTTGAGTLKLAWLIPEGASVNPGDTLIKYDNTNTLLDLETNKNSLDNNKLNTQIQTGTQQFNEKSMQIDRTTAQMDYEYAKTVQPEDPEIFTQWQIIQAAQNADFAKEKIDNLAAKSKIQKRTNRSQQQVSLIQKNRSQLEVNIIQQTLGSMEVQSPAAGLVVYRRDRRQDPKIGDNNQAGQVMIDLVNLNALQARIYVLEREAGSLAKGKPVTVRLDAIPNHEFHGELRSVSPVATALDVNTPLTYFTCEVTITDAGQYLRLIKPGMNLQARVILEKYDSCFMVPSSAVDFRNDQNIVYIKKGNAWEKRVVKVGEGKHGQATILSGVNDRELIALRNPFETRQLKLPDFSKASISNQQQRRGGPGGGMPMGGAGGGGGGGYGGGGGGGGRGGR